MSRLDLSHLNKEQLKIVRHRRGSLLCAAVPGSGKSTTMVYRVAYMVNHGVDPKKILATTFTKKAAAVLTERLQKLGVGEVKIGTLHSVCYEILRKDGKEYGGRFKVVGNTRINKDLAQSIGHKEKNDVVSLKTLVGFAGWCKNWLIGPKKSQKDLPEIRKFINSNCGKYHPSKHERLSELYENLEKWRVKSQILWYDDILYQTYLLLKNDEEVREKWKRRWKYMMVDEVQDTCKAQWGIVRLLVEDHQNLVIVGDHCQSIYGFRAATPELMEEFPDRFDAKVYRMESNYRSGSSITRLADRLISNSVSSLKTSISPQRGVRGTVSWKSYQFHEDEASDIANIIRGKIRVGYNPEEIAILCRTNTISKRFQDVVARYQIPHRVLGGMSLFDYMVIQDVIAYMRLAEVVRKQARKGKGQINVGDFIQVVNRPRRGLGPAFIDKVIGMTNSGSHLIPAIKSSASGRYSAGGQSLIGFLSQISAGKPSRTIVNSFAKNDKFVASYSHSSDAKEIESRIHRLAQVSQSARTLGEFSVLVAQLLLDGDDEVEDEDDGEGKITIATAYKSKGLEFGTVFVPFLADGMYPHSMALESGGKEAIEEEMRVVYVAITRAKDELYLSHSKYSRHSSCTDFERPSRFVRMMGLI